MFTIVESIPDGLSYQSGSIACPSTFSVWSEMVARATSTIEIVSFYWTLTDGTKGHFLSGWQGQQIYNELLYAGTERKIKIKIAQNLPSPKNPSIDSEALARYGAAEVRSLDFRKLVGSGILHTKLWLVDREHVYIGSANMDWRSLTEVKELGVYISDCPTIGEDVGKLFEVYWALGVEGVQVPEKWRAELATSYNKECPMNLFDNGLVYFSSSPPQFCPKGRTTDSDAITSVIAKAKHYIYISVMDYIPIFVFLPKAKYWGVIDTALRTAAIDHSVEVCMLIGWWKHSRERMKLFLKSLVVLSDDKDVTVKVKLFVVPSTEEQNKIPYARVNHSKYMVTDNIAYIGTSNWSADYFTSTGGVGIVVEGDTELRKQLEDVFLRDWNSECAHELSF